MKRNLTFGILSLMSSFTYGQNIPIHVNALYPEGTAYSKKQDVFFVSSIHTGQIGKLDRKGNYTLFTNDPELIATVGIKADESTNTLYVTNVDNSVAVKSNPSTAFKMSEIIGYDLKTGVRKFKIDLAKLNPGQANFINDMTLDAEGNLYVTNSFSPMIFKIDKNHKATIFAQNEVWKGEGFNLNGIVYHPNGYLLVAQSSTGILYKINTKNPSDVQQVQSDVFKGADGLILRGSHELVVICNGAGKIYQVKTTDDWKNATVAGVRESILPFPTTGVLVNNTFHILNGRLPELFDPKAARSTEFMLQEVKF